jgi:hypothetical protein
MNHSIRPPDASSGVRLIAAERQRQILTLWSAEHDDRHAASQLLSAAACYIDHAFASGGKGRAYLLAEYKWPWNEASWKPSDDPIRDLVKAGALIAAEIDRLQRAKETAT